VPGAGCCSVSGAGCWASYQAPLPPGTKHQAL